MMTEMAVKSSVPTPLGYAIVPAAAEAFKSAAREARDPLRDARGAPHGERGTGDARPRRGRLRRGLQPVRRTPDRPPRRGTAGGARGGQPLRPARGRGRREGRARPRAGGSSTASTSIRGSRRSPGRTAPCRSCASSVRRAPSRDGISAALDALLAEEIPPIDHVDLVLVRLPFVRPFAISTAVWTDEGRAAPPARVRRPRGVGRVRGRPRSLLRLRDDGHGPAHPEGLSRAAPRARHHARRARDSGCATCAVTRWRAPRSRTPSST